MAKEIPDKLYFKIHEVSDITDIKPYVLRYWESEFKELKPRKDLNDQRQYKKKDIEMILLIKKLLYEEGFTTTGARKRLKEIRKNPQEYLKEEVTLSTIKEEIKNLIEFTDNM